MVVPKNSEIIVTSHNPKYEFENCIRHEPLNNELEIDRFTEELIQDDMYFLYGDTYYTEKAINAILSQDAQDTIFFGNGKSIVAVKVSDGREFKKHKERVRNLLLEGKIETGKGWQLYQSFTGQDLSQKPEIRDRFIMIDDKTADINTPEDYLRFI